MILAAWEVVHNFRTSKQNCITNRRLDEQIEVAERTAAKPKPKIATTIKRCSNVHQLKVIRDLGHSTLEK